MNLTYKWSVDPLQFLNNVNASVEKITEEVAEEIFDGVVARSPVFTGSFRASWNASVGFPVFQFVQGGNNQNPLPAPSWPKLKVKKGESIHITNGSPYAGRIEDGWSDQAPYGVVALTIASL